MTTPVESDRDGLFLLDTHVLIWSLEEAPRLGSEAKKTINWAAKAGRLAISAITPWEIAMLVSKNRLQLNLEVMEWVRWALARPGISLIPLEPEIAIESTRLPFEMHADPADRILAATARRLGATLVTADRSLLQIAGTGRFRALDAES